LLTSNGLFIKTINFGRLATRLQTGLRNTRCRDVVRVYANNGYQIDWDGISREINQIEIEFDLISTQKRSFLAPNILPKALIDFKARNNNATRFYEKSPYYNRPNPSITPTTTTASNSTNTSTPAQPPRNYTKPVSIQNNKPFFSPRQTPSQKNDLKPPTKTNYFCAEDQTVNYIDVTQEILNDIDANYLSLIDSFKANDWSDQQVDDFLSSQTCSNCFVIGHVIENCSVLRDELKFRQQCLICQTPDVETHNCSCCEKN
jgi:hypothetical protein